ncbi:MAG: low temperature requirement protein A [Verrucomicrobiota bacterium]
MAHRDIWQKPLLHLEETRAERRPTTWLELFFDLFIVVAVSQLSSQLSSDITWGGVGVFVVQFLAVFWFWVGITFYQERFESEGLENRFFLFFLMACVAGMSVFAQHGLTDYYVGFFVSYLAGRVFVFVMWVRAAWHNPGPVRPMVARFAVGFLVSTSVHLLSLSAEGSTRVTLFTSGLLIEVLLPLSWLGINSKLPPVSKSKHPERFGLFTLVVLGETVVAVVSGLRGARMITYQEALTAALALPLCFGMWWVYYDFIGRRPFKAISGVLYGWVYAHYVLFLCVVATGAGVLNLIKDSGGMPQIGAHWLTTGAMAGFFLITAILEKTLEATPDEPTDPLWSPLLKALAAPVAVGIGFWQDSARGLMGWLGVLLAVQMAYGAWRWFTQELNPPAEDTGTGISG